MRFYQAIEKGFSLVLLCLFICISPLQAIDIDQDGREDLAAYIDLGEVVRVFNLEGETLAEVHVPTDFRDGPANLFPAIRNGKLSVYSLVVRKKKLLGTVYVLDETGLVGEIYLGSLKGGTVLAYEINDSGNTDLILVDKQGNTTVYYDPFTSSSAVGTSKVSKKRRDVVSITQYNGQPHIAVFRKKKSRKGKKKRKRSSAGGLSLYSMDGIAAAVLPSKVKLKKTPLPLLTNDSFSSGQFVVAKKANNKTSTFDRVDSLSNQTNGFSSEPGVTLVPGKFLPEGSDAQVVIAGSTTARIHDLNNPGLVLAEIELPFVSSGDSGGGGDSGSGGGSDDCVSQVPTNLLNQIEQAYQDLDYLEIGILVGELESTTYCPETYLLIQEALLEIFGGQPITLPATTDTGFLLPAPVYSSLLSKKKPGDCQKIRGPDGSGGFLYKPVSDSTGKPVVLIPYGIYPTKLWAVKKSGKKIAGSNNTGPSNGRASTWRFSTHLSGQIIIKAFVNTANGEEAWCWGPMSGGSRFD